MKRLFFALLFVCAAALPACQCDQPPHMAPIEGAALPVTAPPALA